MQNRNAKSCPAGPDRVIPVEPTQVVLQVLSPEPAHSHSTGKAAMSEPSFQGLATVLGELLASQTLPRLVLLDKATGVGLQ